VTNEIPGVQKASIKEAIEEIEKFKG